MSNIVETVKNALLAAFTKKNSRFRSIPKDELRSYVFNSNPVAKDALSVALDAVPETDEVEYHNRAEDEKRHKMVPPLPRRLGGRDPEIDGDDNGLVYIERSFTIDPRLYRSANYVPTDINGNPLPPPQKEVEHADPKEETEVSEVSVEDKGGEAVSNGNGEEGKIDRRAEFYRLAGLSNGGDAVAMDEAVAMDAKPKKPKAPASLSKTPCKTTFAECKAANPLYCRFHGPKLLEKDMKAALSSLLGPDSYLSITKDKGQKNKSTFRLTVGCAPSKKEAFAKALKEFFDKTPGLASTGPWKELGEEEGMTGEFDIDILKADEPPEGKSEKPSSYLPKSFKNFMGGKKGLVLGDEPKKEKMEVVGETPQDVLDKIKDGDGDFDKLVEEAAKKMAAEGPKPYYSDIEHTKAEFKEALAGDLVFHDSAFEELKKVLGEDSPVVAAIKEAAKHPNFKTDIPEYAKEVADRPIEYEGIYDLAEKIKPVVNDAIKGMGYEFSVIPQDGDDKVVVNLGKKEPEKDEYGDDLDLTADQITLLHKVLNNRLSGTGLRAEHSKSYSSIGNSAYFDIVKDEEEAEAEPEGASQEDIDALDEEMTALYDEAHEAGKIMPENMEMIEEIAINFDSMKEDGNIEEMKKCIEDMKHLVNRQNGEKAESGSEDPNAITQEQKDQIGKLFLDWKEGAYVDAIGAIEKAIADGAGKEEVKALAKKIYAESIDADNPSNMEDTATAIETVADILGLGTPEFDGADVEFIGDVPSEGSDGLKPANKKWNAILTGLFSKVSSADYDVVGSSTFQDLLKKWNDANAQGDEGAKEELVEAFDQWAQKIAAAHSSGKKEEADYKKEFEDKKDQCDKILGACPVEYYSKPIVNAAIDKVNKMQSGCTGLLESLKGLGDKVAKYEGITEPTPEEIVAKKTMQQAYEDIEGQVKTALMDYSNAVGELKQATEAEMGRHKEDLKAEAASKVEEIVKGMAKKVFPYGNSDAKSATEKFTADLDELKKKAKVLGVSQDQYQEVSDAQGLGGAYSKACTAALDFEALVQDFKSIMNEEGEDFEGGVSDVYLKDTLNSTQKAIEGSAKKMTEAMDAYYKAMTKASSELEFKAEMNKAGSGEYDEMAKAAQKGIDKTAAAKIKEALKGTDFKFDESNMIHPDDGSIWTDNLLKDEAGWPDSKQILEAGYYPETGNIKYLAIAKSGDPSTQTTWDNLDYALDFLGLKGKAGGEGKITDADLDDFAKKLVSKGFMSMQGIKWILSDQFEPPFEGSDALFWANSKERILAVGVDHKVSQAVMKKYKELYGKDLVEGASSSSALKSEEQQIDDITTAIDKKSGIGNDLEFFTGDGLAGLKAKYTGDKSIGDAAAAMSGALSDMGYAAMPDKDGFIEIKKGAGSSNSDATKPHHKMTMTAAKEKVASMSMEDKFKHAINTLKRKLKESKGDEAIAKKLAAYESQLKKIQGITAA